MRHKVISADPQGRFAKQSRYVGDLMSHFQGGNYPRLKRADWNMVSFGIIHVLCAAKKTSSKC